jgi:hypothetical protein
VSVPRDDPFLLNIHLFSHFPIDEQGTPWDTAASIAEVVFAGNYAPKSSATRFDRSKIQVVGTTPKEGNSHHVI